MTLIHIKKIQRRSPESGQSQDAYAVPCVAIATPEGRRLIPNPSGTEAQVFATLAEAEDAVRRAGFDSMFEGQTTHLLAPKTSEAVGSRKNTGRPLEDAVPELIRMLKDRESSVVAAAASALGALRSQTARDPLVSVLGHDDPGVRKNASDALARLGAPAIHALREALVRAQGNQPANAPYIRLSVLSAYLEMIFQGADRNAMAHFLPQAVDCLGDENWLVRAQAAQVIAQAALAIEEEKRRQDARGKHSL